MKNIKVKLPDGSIIRLQVPEGSTSEQIHEFAKKHVVEQKLIQELLAKIPEPKDGEDGKSIKGDKGDPGKNIKGDKGDKGDSIKGDKGDPGADGISIVNVQLNKKKELITTLSNGKKINAGKITEKLASDVFEVFYTNPLKNTTNLGTAIGDIIAFNGTSWEERTVGNTGTQYLAPNNADRLGVSWQDKGFSYLTDELGNALTDELGNALEGKDTVDAATLVNINLGRKTITFADSPYSMTEGDDVVFADATDGNIIIIPQLAANTRTRQTAMKVDSSANTVDIVPGSSELINKAANKLITADLVAWTWASDGTQLLIVA